MRGFIVSALVCLSITAASAQSVVDSRDGRSYSVVVIAGVTWMGENLAYAAEGSSCPQGDAALCDTMGRLYPWTLAMKACPAGWHVSSEEEWQRLERHLGMADADITRDRERGAAQKAGDQLKRGGATRLAFPLAGWRRPDGTFAIGNGRDTAAAIWTGTKESDTRAWHRDLSSLRAGIWRSPVAFDYALSVRCVRDAR
jgi:uncharacterized protein (TIGR02145 family)